MTYPSVGASKFDDELLGALRNVGDVEADDQMTAFFEHELNPDNARDLMSVLVKYAPHSNEASAHLATFIDDPSELPPWRDRTMVREGQELFFRYLPQFGVALWLASIPAGYAGGRDVRAVYRTGQLMKHPERRFLETGQFVLDVMTEGGLDEGGVGTADTRHVRLMHAAVRYMLRFESDDLDCEDWDEASDGVPLNQLALLATMFTFSVVGLESLEKFGIGVSEREAESYVHLWCVVGHLMGIRSDLLPLDLADSRVIWERIKQLEYEQSEEGHELTRQAIEQLKAMIPGRFGDGAAVSGMRFLLGDQTADLLGVPPSDWTRHVFVGSEWIGGLLTRVNRNSSIGRWISGWIGRKIFDAFIEAHRVGERPSFAVPDQLRQQLETSRQRRRTRR